jgi:hypothetical protein
MALCYTNYRRLRTTESFWDNFDYSLEQALNFTENIIITGDLNVDLLTQTNGISTSIHSISTPSQFKSCLSFTQIP